LSLAECIHMFFFANYFKSSIIIVFDNASVLCLQAELRKAQTVAIELRKEAQLRKTIADRKTR